MSDLRDTIRLNEPTYEKRLGSDDDCVRNLAMAMGLLIGAGKISELQAGVYIYSVAKLARKAGVEREVFMQSFVNLQSLTDKILDDIIEEGLNEETKLDIGIDPETNTVVVQVSPTMMISLEPKDALSLGAAIIKTAQTITAKD